MPAQRSENEVGIDPAGAAHLVGLLGHAERALAAQAGRVQRLLDEAGVTGRAPLDIRSAGRTCGEWAGDLRRRSSAVMSPPPSGGARPPGTFVVPRWGDARRGFATAGTCRPLPSSTQPQGPVGATTWITSLGGIHTGPWITPLPGLRTGPWLLTGAGQATGLTQNAATAPDPTCTAVPLVNGGDPIRDRIAANLSSTSRRYTEDELQTGSETLTEEERQAVRDKQAGELFPGDVYAAAVRKLEKSEKVAGARNRGKRRGQPSRR